MDTPSGLLQGGGGVLDVVVRTLLVHAHLPHQRPLTQSDWSQSGGGGGGGGEGGGGDKVTRYIHVHTLALSDSTQSVKVPTHKITICLMLNIAVTLLD